MSVKMCVSIYTNEILSISQTRYWGSDTT